MRGERRPLSSAVGISEGVRRTSRGRLGDWRSSRRHRVGKAVSAHPCGGSRRPACVRARARAAGCRPKPLPRPGGARRFPPRRPRRSRRARSGRRPGQGGLAASKASSPAARAAVSFDPADLCSSTGPADHCPCPEQVAGGLRADSMSGENVLPYRCAGAPPRVGRCPYRPRRRFRGWHRRRRCRCLATCGAKGVHFPQDEQNDNRPTDEPGDARPYCAVLRRPRPADKCPSEPCLPCSRPWGDVPPSRLTVVAGPNHRLSPIALRDITRMRGDSAGLDPTPHSLDRQDARRRYGCRSASSPA